MDLPLANTTFVNGAPYVLRAQKWKVESHTDKASLTCIADRHLPNARLHVDQVSGPPSFVPRYTAHEVLTQPRVVAEAMGNVIRGLARPGQPAEHLPASSELEAAVARMLLPQREPGKAFEVWAAVTPRERVSGPPPSDADLGDRILQGQRLHRVTGGGGGWGSKRGLISLEPFDAQTSVPGMNARDQIFGTTVQNGDQVSFFALWYPDGSASREVFPDPSVEQVSGTGVRRIELGSAGPPPESFNGPPSSSVSPDCVYVDHYFGALSERGASLNILTRNNDDTESSSDRGPAGLVRGTKLPPLCGFEWSQPFGGTQA